MSKVNILTATAKTLTTLPGIGQSKARSIVEMREHFQDQGQTLSFMHLRDSNILPPHVWDKFLQDERICFVVGEEEEEEETTSTNQLLETILGSLHEELGKIEARITNTVESRLTNLQTQHNALQQQFQQSMMRPVTTTAEPMPDGIRAPTTSGPTWGNITPTVTRTTPNPNFGIPAMGNVLASSTPITQAPPTTSQAMIGSQAALGAVGGVGTTGMPLNPDVTVPPPQIPLMPGLPPINHPPPGFPAMPPAMPPQQQPVMPANGIYQNPVRPQVPRDVDNFPPPVNARRPRLAIGREPPPPKMSTYNGQQDWRPYIMQFERMARRYNWTPEERLDRLTDSLRDKALDFYGSLDDETRENYHLLSLKLDQRFGCTDPPASMRRKLASLKQRADEKLEEFAERAQKLAQDSYPHFDGEAVLIIQTMAMEAFLRGCTHQQAAVQVLNREPRDLAEALRQMKIHVQNYETVFGAHRKAVKAVSFEDSDEEEFSVREAKFAGKQKSVEEKVVGMMQKPLSAAVKEGIEEGLKGLASVLREIMTAPKPNSPNKKIPASPPGTPPRSQRQCFNCGDTSHFAKECPKKSPSKSSPSKPN